MYTNEEIRSYMGELVDKKGPEHQAPAMYAHPDGTGACFLGALCELMGVAVPNSGVIASQVLGDGNVSKHMQAVFMCAQYMNDTGFQWKWVLIAADEILQLDESKLFRMSQNGGIPGCPCGCTNADRRTLSYEIEEIISRVRIAKEKERIEKSAEAVASAVKNSLKFTPVGVSSFSAGGVIAPLAGYPSLAGVTVEMNLPALSVTKPKQKDHALVA